LPGVFRQTRTRPSVKQLLQLVPTESTAVIFLDLDQFRNSPFLAKTLFVGRPFSGEDAEYAQFVRDNRLLLRARPEKTRRRYFQQRSDNQPARNCGRKFDRKRIEAFLNHGGQPAQQGRWKVFPSERGLA